MADPMISSGLILAWPWILLALPLPWLLRKVLSPAPQTGMQALKVPWYAEITDSRGVFIERSVIPVILLLLIFQGCSFRQQ